MKKITILALLILASIGFNSCEDDDSIQFIAQAPEEFNFSNSFLSEYVLTLATSGNLGERFTWNDADFDVPTIVSYDLQKSITGDFSDMEVIGTTTENELSVTIGDLLGYARDAGLDNDPATEDPNTGDVYFRIKAYVGNSGPETLSDTQALTLVLPEDTGNDDPVCDLDVLYLVGAGVPDAGWDWTTPIQLPCTGDGIYSGNVNFINDAFRMFTANGDWNSGLNYPYYDGEGYTIDANFEDAFDGDNNFQFVGIPGFYNIEVDTFNKTITLTDPQPTGVCDLDQLWLVGAGVPDAGWDWTTPIQVLCTGDGVYSGNVNFANEAFRMFTANGDWNSGQNYPFYFDDGYTIDANFEDALDGDNNFRFIGTPGIYYLTIDTFNKVISLE